MAKKQKDFLKGKYNLQIALDTVLDECAIGSSSGDPWTDMAVCLEGLSVICQKCIESGMSPKKVYTEVDRYLLKAHDGYNIKRDIN